MDNEPKKPIWRTIEFLPTLEFLLNGGYESNLKQYNLYLEAKDKPHALDDQIIDRSIKLFTSQLDDMWYYEKQISRWKKENPDKQLQLDHLFAKYERFKEITQKILALVDGLKKHTINRILEMDDIELAKKTMSGEIPFPKF